MPRSQRDIGALYTEARILLQAFRGPALEDAGCSSSVSLANSSSRTLPSWGLRRTGGRCVHEPKVLFSARIVLRGELTAPQPPSILPRTLFSVLPYSPSCALPTSQYFCGQQAVLSPLLALLSWPTALSPSYSPLISLPWTSASSKRFFKEQNCNLCLLTK